MILASLVDGCGVLNDIVHNELDDVLNDISDLIGLKAPLVPFSLSTAILSEKCLSRPDVNCLKLFGLFTLCIELCLLDLFECVLQNIHLLV